MKKWPIYALFISLATSAALTEQQSHQLVDASQQPPVTIKAPPVALSKATPTHHHLMQVVSTPWQTCRQECRDEQSLCLQNGFDRPSCRLWYLQCLSDNCP